jgi:hypothetical protein
MEVAKLISDFRGVCCDPYFVRNTSFNLAFREAIGVGFRIFIFAIESMGWGLV